MKRRKKRMEKKQREREERQKLKLEKKMKKKDKQRKKNALKELAKHERMRRAATARPERIWDYGVIPYEIEANFSGRFIWVAPYSHVVVPTV